VGDRVVIDKQQFEIIDMEGRRVAGVRVKTEA
jgi:CBS domain containing-hemolysin-like protein